MILLFIANKCIFFLKYWVNIYLFLLIVKSLLYQSKKQHSFWKILIQIAVLNTLHIHWKRPNYTFHWCPLKILNHYRIIRIILNKEVFDFTLFGNNLLALFSKKRISSAVVVEALKILLHLYIRWVFIQIFIHCLKNIQYCNLCILDSC